MFYSLAKTARKVNVNYSRNRAKQYQYDSYVEHIVETIVSVHRLAAVTNILKCFIFVTVPFIFIAQTNRNVFILWYTIVLALMQILGCISTPLRFIVLTQSLFRWFYYTYLAR